MKTIAKTLCLAVVLLLLAAGSMAQNQVEMLSSLQIFGAQSLDYHQRKLDITDVKGSPYLTAEFQEGKLLMSNILYEGVQFRYNVYSDRFEVRLNQETIELDPVKNAIDTLYYSGYKFVRRFLPPDKNRKLSYVAVIHGDGSITLLKQFRISFNPARDAGAYEEAKPAEFIPVSPEYFLERGGEQIQVSGVKSVAGFFGVDVKEVKSYLKSNQMKISDEEDLARICAHFSEDNSR
jgi:hypothetical protein